MMILIIILSLLCLALLIFARRYLKLRGAMVVTCPETNRPAGVHLDARHAALTSIMGRTDFLLKDCSRWPERMGCGQECLRQIELAPTECLVRTILTKWYEGKACQLCGRDIGPINWMENKPALMSPDHKTMEWDEIPAEKIPEVLSTHSPVCWNCHIAETFRRLYPDMIVERPWKRG